MPLDTSIPFRAMATVPLLSPQEHQQNALARQMQQLQLQNAQGEMQDRLSARTQQNALAEAYKSAYGANGELDQNALLTNMAKSGLGSQIPGLQKTFAEQKKAGLDADSARLKNMQEHVQRRLQLMSTVRDQTSHMQAVARLKAEGEDVSDIPMQFDPAYYQSAMNEGLSIKDQLEQKMAVRRQTEVERNNQTQNRISQGNLGVAQANLGLSRQRLQNEQGQVVETANGPVVVDRRTGQAVPVSVNGQQVKPAKKSAAGISPTLQKELIQTDEEVQAGTAALGLITKAKAASKKAYSGWGAGMRAVVASNLGVGGSGADATVELNNLVTSQALETLKATFGGAPTEGERKILLDIQAAPDKTPAQRESILNRAQAAVERRVRLAQGKSKAIRSGKYLTEEYDPGADMQPAGAAGGGGAKFLGFE